ncbi:unnamed protein product [Caenorhabditis angaria]|uniref:Uncharacterized protein n=1 Tax=Caenorhabditis angaria TaxID=860376 RepID=A0A9P1J1K2_9PELO|nr:unnamed protein product [Caenorhabditis angaria]
MSSESDGYLEFLSKPISQVGSLVLDWNRNIVYATEGMGLKYFSIQTSRGDMVEYKVVDVNQEYMKDLGVKFDTIGDLINAIIT